MDTLLITVLCVLLAMSGFYFMALLIKNNGIVDIAWGLGFVLIVWIEFLHSGTAYPVQWITAFLVTAWGLRLAVHIYLRNRKRGEDYRYRAFREKWGKWFALKSYLFIFLFQGFLMLIIGSPLMLIQRFPVHGFSPHIPAGIVIWLCGFVIEMLADSQLRTFRRKEKSEKNPVCMKGLWRYSRHPNYFGEALLWWGIWIISLSTPHGIAAVVSPVLIGFLLVRVSGIPLLERRYAADPAYQAYARRTSIFIPWFPKRTT